MSTQRIRSRLTQISPPLQKIKISTVAARVESSEERKETQDRVDEERRYQTDVRIYAFHDTVSY